MSSDDFGVGPKGSGSTDMENGPLDIPPNQESWEIEPARRASLEFESSDLDEAFAAKLEATLGECEKQGVTMVPYAGIRDPWEQARLWRQSRTTAVVNQAIARLESSDAGFLAAVLRDVGPQRPAPRVTNALPGFSWHQFGEAADCYWQVDGRPEWDDLTGYRVYAENGVKQGLTAGGYWPDLKDWPHLQLRPNAGPGSVYSTKEINDRMLQIFGGPRKTDRVVG